MVSPEAIAGRAALFVIVSFLTYFAHLLGFAAAAFILVLYELTSFNWREWLRLACFLAPPSLLFLWARPGLSQQSSRLEWRPLLEKLASAAQPAHAGIRRAPRSDFSLRPRALPAGGRGAQSRAARELAMAGGRRWASSESSCCCRMAGERAPISTCGWCRRSACCALAVFRVGRRANWIAVLAVALTVLRVFNVTTGFQDETQKNAAMNHGIEQIARNARVFPLVDTCKDDDPLDYYYVHYWAYAVIRRGAVSPYLFDIPGQTPMRITWEPYMSDGYWGHCYDVRARLGAGRRRLRLHLELRRSALPARHRRGRGQSLRGEPADLVPRAAVNAELAGANND